MSHDHCHLGVVLPCSLTMEAKIIRKFLPNLIAISDCVYSISDRCLAEGLISDSTYRKVLESGGTSEDKNRNLLLAVIKTKLTAGALVFFGASTTPWCEGQTDFGYEKRS